MFAKWIEARRAERMERRVFAELYKMAMAQMLENSYCAECDGNCEVCQNDTTDCD
jgi:hypothetical protein